MGSVAGCGGEEEAENLRAINMLHDVLDSFAKRSSYESGSCGTRKSQQKSHKKAC